MGWGGRRGESRPQRAAATLGAEGGVDRSGSHCLPQAPACGSQASPRSSHRPSPGGRSLRGPGVMGEEVAPHTPSPDSRRPSASSNCQPAHASAAPPLGSAPGGALSACLPLGFWRAAWDAGQAGAQPEAAVDGARGPSVPSAHPAGSASCVGRVLHSPTRCRGPGPLGVRGLVPRGSHRDSQALVSHWGSHGQAQDGTLSTRPVGRLSVSSAPPHGDWDGVLRPSRSVRNERCGVASGVLRVRNARAALSDACSAWVTGREL